jgi:hypothetical protein
MTPEKPVKELTCQFCGWLLEEKCDNWATTVTNGTGYVDFNTHYFQCSNPKCGKKYGIDRDGVVYQIS